YCKKYVSVFLPTISCFHTGRLTSERNTEKLNAYDLNNQSQFVKKEDKIIIVNLDRRKDRYENVKKQYEKYKNYKLERFSAIDGTKLMPTERLQRLFDGNDYNMRVGMVGCALSHIQLYINLLKSNDSYYIILEDDITLHSKFDEKLKEIQDKLFDYDIC